MIFVISIDTLESINKRDQNFSLNRNRRSDFYSHVLKGLGCELSHLLVVCLGVVSELYGRIEISWRLDVWVIKHGDNTHDY